MAKPTDKQHIRDWFALGCGLFGIWELLLAAHWMISALDIMTGLYRSTSPGTTLPGAMVNAVCHGFLALWLLASARKLAAFWYPDMPSDDKVADEKESETKTI
jgi:hypothetical protein